ncbi:MAG: hypothetical protein LQ342_006497 [Letrouitia transgressa]|nr:MAG: hypothetical protein LQ342_006497 [Letrouitia transgressa]
MHVWNLCLVARVTSLALSGALPDAESEETSTALLGLAPLPYPRGYGPSSCRYEPGAEGLSIENSTRLRFVDSGSRSQYQSPTSPAVPVQSRPPTWTCLLRKRQFVSEARESFLSSSPTLLEAARSITWSFSFTCRERIETLFILARDSSVPDNPEFYHRIKVAYPNDSKGIVYFYLSRRQYVKGTLYFEPRGVQYCELAIFENFRQHVGDSVVSEEAVNMVEKDKRTLSTRALDLAPLPYPPGFQPASCRYRPVADALTVKNTTGLTIESQSVLRPSPSSGSISATQSTAAPAYSVNNVLCEMLKTLRFTSSFRVDVRLEPVLLPQLPFIRPAGYYVSFTCNNPVHYIWITARKPQDPEAPQNYLMIARELFHTRQRTIEFGLVSMQYVRVYVRMDDPQDINCEIALFRVAPNPSLIK